ncbi:MAG: slipin family protein [Nanopusillaceae archaeon]
MWFWITLILFVVFISLRVANEYERAVILRLGRFIDVRGPGLFFIIPIIEKSIKVDTRVRTIDVPKQRVITKDNVSIEVDAVVYFRVQDPVKAVLAVENYYYATGLLAQTILRDVLGQEELDNILSKREELNEKLRSILDKATDEWGIKVTSVTIKDIILPETLLRALAKQAEAEREKKARIIVAEGELIASKNLIEAAKLIEKHPIALRLRELQTLVEIAKEKNLVIVTPESYLGTLVGISKKAWEK